MNKFLMFALVSAGVLFFAPQLLTTFNIPATGIFDEIITGALIALVLVFVLKA